MQNLGAQPITDLSVGDDATNLEQRFMEWSEKIATYIASVDPYADKESELEAEKAVAKKKKIISNDRYRKFINKTKKQSSENSSCCGNKDESGACNHSANTSNPVDITAPVPELLAPEEGELEEEDIINNGFVDLNDSKEQTDGCNSDHEGEEAGNHKDMVDVEDLGSRMSAQKKAALASQLRDQTNGNGNDNGNGNSGREMVTKLQRKALVKEGYRIIGTHSAVKLCRWTKNQMRGRGY